RSLRAAQCHRRHGAAVLRDDRRERVLPRAGDGPTAPRRNQGLTGAASQRVRTVEPVTSHAKTSNQNWVRWLSPSDYWFAQLVTELPKVIQLVATLSLLRRDIPDRHRELRMLRRINRSVPDSRARRILAKMVVILPVRRWPDRPRGESSAAIRADIVQDAFNAAHAESTFIGTNSRFERIPWQFLVSVFAGRTQLEHRSPPQG